MPTWMNSDPSTTSSWSSRREQQLPGDGSRAVGPGRCAAMTYREFFSHVVDVVEVVGAAILVLGGLGAFVCFGYELVARDGRGAYTDLRQNLGRVILLGLEVLIVADIIRTIVVDQSVESVTVSVMAGRAEPCAAVIGRSGTNARHHRVASGHPGTGASGQDAGCHRPAQRRAALVVAVGTGSSQQDFDSPVGVDFAERWARDPRRIVQRSPSGASGWATVVESSALLRLHGDRPRHGPKYFFACAGQERSGSGWGSNVASATTARVGRLRHVHCRRQLATSSRASWLASAYGGRRSPITSFSVHRTGRAG